MRAAALLLAAATFIQAPTISLRIRVFDGTTEITDQSRVTVFKAGDRQTPIAAANGAFEVAPGFYDAQVIREQDGKVTGIQWAEKLVVMAYPDEAGQHLEVVNLRSGFGALEVRGTDAEAPDAAIFAKGAHDKEIARPIEGTGYALFVVPAGVYDVRVRSNGEATWRSDIEVPADRTRFWLVSQSKAPLDAPARQQPQHDNHERDHQQNVDEPAGDVQAESEYPQDQQQNDNRPEHQPPCTLDEAIKMPRESSR